MRRDISANSSRECGFRGHGPDKRSTRVLAISVSAQSRNSFLRSSFLARFWYSLKQVALRLVKVRHRFRPAPFARSLLYHPSPSLHLLIFPLRAARCLRHRFLAGPSPSLSFRRSNGVPHSTLPHPLIQTRSFPAENDVPPFARFGGIVRTKFTCSSGAASNMRGAPQKTLMFELKKKFTAYEILHFSGFLRFSYLGKLVKIVTVPIQRRIEFVFKSNISIVGICERVFFSRDKSFSFIFLGKIIKLIDNYNFNFLFSDFSFRCATFIKQ